MLVGICVERSLEMIVGLLAILKAGGAYVPLDPEYPAERLAFLLADSAAAGSARPSDACCRPCRKAPPECCAWTPAAPAFAAASDCQPAPLRVTPDDLAYVIYTSGSTGVPKGVTVTPPQCRPAVPRDRAVVPLRRARRLDAVPLVRL